MTLRLLLTAATTALMLLACGQKKPPPAYAPQAATAADTLGLALLEQKCGSCHGNTATPDTRIAPHMLAVKRHYLRAYPAEADFVDHLTGFALSPDAAAALMPGAVARHGLMPRSPFDSAQVRTIAAWLYSHNPQAPAWFEPQWQQEQAGTAPADTASPGTPQWYTGQARKMAMQTKAVLGKNLNGAINSKGTLHAVQFCNTRALPLTDSMSRALSTTIRRVSDQPRNPANAATPAQQARIAKMKQALAAGQTLKPELEDKGATMLAYIPIETQGMCLQCHGKPGADIQTGVQARLKQLYPADKATGYSANQLRGMWVVEMKKIAASGTRP